MTREPRDRGAAALDRYWDAVVDGQAPAVPPDGVGEAAAALARRLHALGGAPGEAGARARVWARLARQTERGKDTAMGTAATAAPPAPGVGANGRRGPTPLIGGLRRAANHLATAALLLLVLALAVGYAAFAPGPPASDRPVLAPVPGASLPSTGADAAAAETLLAVDLPPGATPHGARVGGLLGHVTFSPRATTAWDGAAGACCPGLRVEYVLGGGYRARAEGPVGVVRAGWAGAQETVAAGTDVALGPGDALLAPTATTVAYANPGDAPAELLIWVLADEGQGGLASFPLPPGWYLHDVDDRPGTAVPDGPATLRLRRVELAPGAAFPAPVGALQLGVSLPENSAGTPVPVAVGTGSTGTVRNTSRAPVVAYVATLEAAGAAGGVATP